MSVTVTIAPSLTEPKVLIKKLQESAPKTKKDEETWKSDILSF